jgi:hypothetical protein
LGQSSQDPASQSDACKIVAFTCDISYFLNLDG